MPMIEIDAAERQQPQGLRPVGIPSGMVVTRDERSPPIRESAPVQSDMQGQDAPPTSGEMWSSAFRDRNEIVSAAAVIGEPHDFGERDPDHNPWDTIAGTPLQQHWQSFVGSKNAAETEAIRARVQRQLDDKSILERSGWAGVGAGMVASILSPTTLLPFGSVRTGFRGLTAAGRTAASTSAWAGAAVGLQEAALLATQETRSAYESLLNIAGASIVGGALGAGASAFGSRRLAMASRAIDNDLRAIVREAKAIDEAERSAGAAVGAQVTRQVQENIVADALGVEKVFAFQSPMTRALASPITAVRDIVSRLAEIPFNLRQNELGVRTGPAIGSVESRIKVDGELALYRMQEQMINSFAAHRFENAGARAPLARDTFSAAVGTRPEGKLSWKEFKTEVTKALRSETKAGIEHPIPEVKAAAEAVRKNVFEPFKVEAQKLGLFAEDAEFATGYVMRKYDVDAILRERPKFEQILVDWLREGQTRARAELADLEAKLAGAAPADDLLTRARSAVERYAEDIKARRAESKATDEADLAVINERLKTAQGDERTALETAKQDIEARLADEDRVLRDIQEALSAKTETRQKITPTADAAKAPNVDDQVRATVGDLAERYGIELPPGLADMSPDDLLKAAQKAIAGSEKADAKAGKAKAKADEATMARRDAVRHWADADEQELRAIASDVTNKIIGAPGGRTVNPYQTYDLPAGPRGPLQARTLTIPDEKIAEFLDDDIERIARAYVRTMAPDVALAREFGTIDFGDESPVMRQIADEVYRTNANTPQRAEELSRASLVAKRDIPAMVARLRGTYNQGEDPLAWGPWLARTAKKVNILRLMGNVLSASISDPLRMLMVHGFRANVDLFQTLLTDVGRAKISRQQAKELGAGLELALSRSHVLADIADDFGGHSKFDRALDAAVNKFGRLNLMDPWNAILKQTAGALAVNRILKASEALMTGKISPKDLRRLAASGIDRETAEIIVEQVGKHGDIHGSLRLANAGAWDDTPLVRQARMALEAAVRRDADRTVVTPGQDKPLWLSGTLGSVIGQFRTFQMVSIQRTLIAGLQERDAAFVAGLAGLIGMGIVSEHLKMLVHGKEEKDGPKHIGDWMYAGLANSGALGWITDADQAVHKISGGNVSAAKLVFQNSRPISRFASQSIVGSTLGPTFGGATDAMKAINAGFTGKVTEADVHAMRRLLPYQNLMYISRALRAFEEGMVEKFNLPRTPTRN